MRRVLEVVRTLLLAEGLLLAPGFPLLLDSGSGWPEIGRAGQFYLFALGCLCLGTAWALATGRRRNRWALAACGVAHLPGYPYLTAIGVVLVAAAALAWKQGETDEDAPAADWMDWAGWIAVPFSLCVCWLGAGWVHTFARVLRLPPLDPWLGFGSLWTGLILCLVVHEWGHRAAARLMSLRMVESRGPVSWLWRWQPAPAGGQGRAADQLFVYHLGGPAASAALAGLGLALCATGGGRFWAGAAEAFGLIAVASLSGFCFCMVPLRLAGYYSDGAYVMHLVRGGHQARRRIALARLGVELARGTRPADWDRRLLNVAARPDDPRAAERSRDYGTACALKYLRSLDEGHMSSADYWASRMHAVFSGEKAALPGPWRLELAYHLAMHVRTSAAGHARDWLESAGRSPSNGRLRWLRAAAAVAIQAGDLERARQLARRADRLLLLAPLRGSYQFERELWEDLCTHFRGTQDVPPITATAARAPQTPSFDQPPLPSLK